MMDFDPNKKFKPSSWATYIPGRNPKFKAHSNRGLALGACTYGKRPFILYQFNGKLWIEIYRRELDSLRNKPANCERCRSAVQYPKLKWTGKKSGESSDLKMLWLCSTCEKWNDRQMWEYKNLSFEIPLENNRDARDKMREELADAGIEGWEAYSTWIGTELAHITQVVYFMKRWVPDVGA